MPPDPEQGALALRPRAEGDPNGPRRRSLPEPPGSGEQSALRRGRDLRTSFAPAPWAGLESIDIWRWPLPELTRRSDRLLTRLAGVSGARARCRGRGLGSRASPQRPLSARGQPQLPAGSGSVDGDPPAGSGRAACPFPRGLELPAHSGRRPPLRPQRGHYPDRQGRQAAHPESPQTLVRAAGPRPLRGIAASAARRLRGDLSGRHGESRWKSAIAGAARCRTALAAGRGAGGPGGHPFRTEGHSHRLGRHLLAPDHPIRRAHDPADLAGTDPLPHGRERLARGADVGGRRALRQGLARQPEQGRSREPDPGFIERRSGDTPC
jgi:hypothetical protein